MRGQYTSRPTRALAGLVALLPCLAADSLATVACSRSPDREASATTTEGEQLLNGRWFDGERFHPDTFYSAGGVLTRSQPAVVRRIVDLGGGYVVPPFGEAHNHNVQGEWNVDAVVQRYLRDGVFYVAIPGNIAECSARIVGRVNTPASIDVSFANAGLTGSGGHPIPLYEDVLRTERYEPAIGQRPRGWFEGRACFVIDSEADLRSKWEAIIATRPGLIKVYLVHSEDYGRTRDATLAPGRTGLNPALIPAIVARARDGGLRVAAHVETAEDFRVAVRAGVDQITHLPGWLVRTPGDARDARVTDDDAREGARTRVTVITTTVAARGMPGVPHAPAHRTHGAQAASPRVTASPVAHAAVVMTHNLRVLHDNGAAIAIGSDHADTPLEEAMNLHAMRVFDNATLLRLWSEATPRTIFPGRRIGRLDEGYEASFLVLAGDPIADFDQVREIRARFKQGRELALPPAR